MAKRSRRTPTRPSQPRRRSRAGRTRGPADEPPDLITEISRALDGSPLDLLAQVSGVLAVLDPRAHSPLSPEPEIPVPALDELMLSFFEIEMRETSALLLAISELAGQELLLRRVRREMVDREDALPRWLTELGRTEPVPRAVEFGHVLGDGDNILLAARLRDGTELTAVVYIDHNLGTAVKDAFVVEDPLEVMIGQLIEVADDPDTSVRELDLADARTRVVEAIEHGAQMHPPLESDTWPISRPLVEWMVGLLPAGGTGYQRPEWSEADLAELTERFLGSPHGAGFDDAEHRSLLDSLLWFGTDYGPGDPLRWSPTAVEIVLLDWFPRKIVADLPFLRKLPALLRAFVRFCHTERGIRASLTEQTIDTLDDLEPEYRRIVAGPRPKGPEALLAAVGLLATNGAWSPEPGEELPDYHEIMLDTLERAVGGAAALDALTADPLPDVPFDWAPVPAEIGDRVRAVLELVDACCDTMLDAEYRTAARRVLARAAAADPEIFRRRGRADTAAAAVCWLVGKANGLFDAGRPLQCSVKQLSANFGLTGSTHSQRAAPFLRALGVDPSDQYGRIDLGSPDYLIAARRSEIITNRDRYRAMAD